MNILMTMEFVVDVPAKQAERTRQTVEVASEFAKKYLRAQGIEVVTTSLVQRPLTKEERMRLVPPRTHYLHDAMFGALCGRSRSRRTSKDWNKVDCKYCLKLQPESKQKSLF